MSKYFILDEWIWHDLSGENGEENFKLAAKFLIKLFFICDKIIIAKKSKFLKKQYQFNEKLNNEKDITKVEFGKFYFKLIYLNSEKYIEIDIDEESEIDIPDVNPDDHYLIKTYNSAKKSDHFERNETSEILIITSDSKLYDILKQNNFNVYKKDNFLENYINK